MRENIDEVRTMDETIRGFAANELLCKIEDNDAFSTTAMPAPIVSCIYRL